MTNHEKHRRAHWPLVRCEEWWGVMAPSANNALATALRAYLAIR